MTCLSRSTIALAFCLACIGNASAVAPEIKDDAKYFSADAVKKANDTIRELCLKTGKDLLIETFASVPGSDGDRESVRDMSAEERLDYFGKLARKRAERAVVNGVYIFICKDPTFFRIEVSKTSQKVFDAKAVSQLQKIVMDNFKEKRFDEGLLAGARFVVEGFAAGKIVLAPEVKDQGKFFTAEGIKSANEIIREIATKYKKDVVFETYAGVPADDVEMVKAFDGKEKFDYYRKWALKRIEALKMNGVFLIATKTPTFFKIEVSARARSDFDRKAIARLQKAVIDEFRDGRYDEGLLAGVKVVRDVLAAAKKE